MATGDDRRRPPDPRLPPYDDRPSWRVLAVAGAGVLAVVAFTVAVALGGHTVDRPGDRVEVVTGSGPLGATVLAGRCLDQRVTAVALTALPDAGVTGSAPLWRIESAKGSIVRSYELGGSAPDGFALVTPLAARPVGPVRVSVTFARFDHGPVEDGEVVDLGALPASPPAPAGPVPCGGKADLGLTTVLFGLGAAAVVGTYGAMVRRRWRAPR